MLNLSAAERERSDRWLRRLARLQGGDPGFFVLAAHSFVEGVLRDRFVAETRENEVFHWYVGQFRRHLVDSADRFLRELSALQLLIDQHRITNDVRHRFCEVDAEEAGSALHLLRQFCLLAGVADLPGLAGLVDGLKAWEERRCPLELMNELTASGFRLLRLQRENRSLTERVAELQSAELQLQHIGQQKALLERRLAELSESAGRKSKRVDELRRTLHDQKREFSQEQQQLLARIRELEPVRDYLDTLSRVTVYTRTRFDYERSITRLTREQQRILEQINMGADFLVKGSAGTGKTLVLIKALEKARGSDAESLGLDLDVSVALLTFTNALVKYDRYVATLIGAGYPGEQVLTADAFLLQRIQEIFPGATVSYEILETLVAERKVSGITPAELAAEAESFIWANDVSADEYISEGIDRRGMKKPLGRQQRAGVWQAVQAMAAEMDARAVFSKNYSRCRLLRFAQQNPGDPRLQVVDHIFIDEVQDLSAVELKALKCCARRSVIMAGDSDQAIYQAGFTFRRAGIDIQGRSRILRTNFRNTLQLQQLAEGYRATMPGFDAENQPEAFRMGPPPELYTAATKDELQDLLLRRVSIFLDHLGYDPENIAILVPFQKEIETLAEALEAAGYPAVNIKDRDFEFSRPGALRLSTMHSSKGLDFPVVLLYLYRPPYPGSVYSDETAERISRNLIYVSLTRAMDHLNVFCLAGTGSRSIGDLIAAFETLEPAGQQAQQQQQAPQPVPYSTAESDDGTAADQGSSALWIQRRSRQRRSSLPPAGRPCPAHHVVQRRC